MAALFAFLAPPAFAGAGNSKPSNPETVLCSLLLNPKTGIIDKDAFAKTRPGYKPRKAQYRFGGNRDVETRDQGEYGSCWLFAGLRFVEACARYNSGFELRLSEDYLLAKEMIRLAEEKQAYQVAPRHRLKPALKDDGGKLADAFKALRRHGAVPTKAWEARIKLGKSKAENQRLLLLMNLKIAQHDLADIQSDVESYFGALPETFKIFGDKTLYTPRTFAAQKLKLDELEHYLDLRRVEGSPRKIADAIVAQLEATGGQIPVPFAFHWVGPLYSKGLFSVDAHLPFQNPLYRDPKTLGILAAANDAVTNHAALITDYEPGLTPGSPPRRFFIANSYGKSDGKQGYLEMDWDYFEAFVQDADVIRAFTKR